MFELPDYKIQIIKKKSTEYCIGIPIIDEGERFKSQIKQMKALGLSGLVDIIIFDGGSTDGSIDLKFLEENGVSTLLVKTSSGRLGAQLRMGYHYILEQGYKGLVTIDGNNKDSVEDIPKFIDDLDKGYDFIQGSRYIKGGKAINTPILRNLAVKYVHSVWISLLAGFKYTDTTNGFRGISSKVLNDNKLKLFRNIFNSYEILFYMSARVPQLGYKVKERPVTRSYPSTGKTPSKIKFMGNFKIIYALILLTLRRFDA